MCVCVYVCLSVCCVSGMICSGRISIAGRKKGSEIREAKVSFRGVADDIIFALKDDQVLTNLLA